MTAVTTQARITPLDRFGLTLCLAIIIHGVIILGVTFADEDTLKPRFETMEIILVQQESEPDEEAELLAQANLKGGGESPDKETPATKTPAPFPDQKPEDTAPPRVQAEPPAKATPPAPEPEKAEPDPEPAEVVEKMTVESETPQDPEPEAVAAEPKETQPIKQEKPASVTEAPETREKPVRKKEETPPLPSATALLTNSFKIASLSAEVRRKLDAKSKRPRRKFISANTKEYKYAAYMEAWRAKVERVGNLNYPDEARKRNLSGNLILDVALNNDGSVREITVRRSSGHRILDDAAIRIVELSAPFAPFPDQIRKETDILHITRTWQFLNNNRFR